MSDEVIDFDELEPAQLNFKYKDKHYVLREASTDAVRQYQNAQLKAGRLSEDGVSATIEGLADANPILVSMCLFEVTDKGEKRVSKDTILTWLNRVQQRLYDWVVEHSDLNVPDTIERIDEVIGRLQRRRTQLIKSGATSSAKNGVSATTVGSV